MKTALYLALALSTGGNLSALELNRMSAADVKSAVSAQPGAPAAVTAAAAETSKAYQNVWMSVRNNQSWQEAEAYDYSSRIETRVRKVFDGQYDVSIHTDLKYEWATIRKNFGKDFQLSGSGMYLSMNEWGGNYSVSGNVQDQNNQTKYINLTLHKRFDDGSFNITGAGIYLNIDPNSVNGNYDDQQYSKKAIAAVISLALAARLEKTPAPKTDKAVRAEERIWLTMRSNTGWYLMEAEDPFSRIEVNLRKVFDREYDVEMTADNDREFGRVSNFFSDRYELRAGRTDLTMREWAGDYTIEGDVAVDGAAAGSVHVRLEMRRRFSDFSFYIRDTGIHLLVDQRDISGSVDTKVYPKKAVAAIAALIMSLKQDQPSPAEHQDGK